jgi:pimeloyl-ACP methyl ester carboxylesterase
MRHVSWLLLGLFILNGCYRHDAPVPVPITHYPAGTKATDTLIVMLPGRGGSMKDFEKGRFIDLARQKGITSDILTVDLHEGYYYNRSMIDRLRIDVIEPALKKGYRQIWFVGVSLGGFGALMYAKQNNSKIAGIVLIAPYLGDKIIDEISSAGGISKWQPRANSSAEDYEIDLWKWLKAGHGATPLYLIYGADDRMADAHRMLSELLPKEHVITTDGGHDWNAWTSLWTSFLDQKIL